MAVAIEKWWLLGVDRKPVGPVTTELLVEGITAGKVPPEALVCIVGGTEWEAVGEIAQFASVVTEVKARSASEPPGPKRGGRKLAELEQSTIVDGIPLWPAEAPSEVDATVSTLRQQMVRFDDAEERTIVDASPLPSDPPE